VLFTFATYFFGGGYMVFVIWLVLFGLGIYIHGLFSEQILEWAGVMMILLGVGSLALPAPYVATQWLAASAFGVGMPLLSTMLDRGASRPVWLRAAQSALWLAVVLTPPIVIYQWWKSQPPPAAPKMTLESFMRQANARATAIVAIPAGSRVPVNMRIDGGLLVEDADTTLLLTLARPVEVVVVDGKPNGQFRVAGGPWRQRAPGMWFQHLKLRGTLAPDAGPAASVSLVLIIDR
jgi:hypothetical protein